MAEVSLVLITAQGVLDVPSNRRVYILIGAFLAGEGRRFVIVNAAQAHRTAVTNILVDAMNSQHRFKFPIGNERRMQHHAAIVKLFVLRE